MAKEKDVKEKDLDVKVDNPSENAGRSLGIEDTKKALKTEPKVKIMVASSESDKNPFVDMRINGVGYPIKKDTETVIPLSVYNALLDCKEERYREKKRDDGQGVELVKYFVNRYSITKLGDA